MKARRARVGRRALFARQEGVALVMVLWILLLVTISTSAYTLMARMDQLEAHTVLSGTRARLAAEAGMNLAVLSLIFKRAFEISTNLSAMIAFCYFVLFQFSVYWLSP